MNTNRAAVKAWEALFRAQVAVLRDIGAEFITDTISLTEYDVLFNLSRAENRSARLGELTKHLLITQPSVSRLVDRLVLRGLLSKCVALDDGRGTVVTLTDAGEALFRELGKHHAEAISRRFGSILNSEELETLTKLCDRLRNEPVADD